MKACLPVEDMFSHFSIYSWERIIQQIYISITVQSSRQTNPRLLTPLRVTPRSPTKVRSPWGKLSRSCNKHSWSHNIRPTSTLHHHRGLSWKVCIRNEVCILHPYYTLKAFGQDPLLIIYKYLLCIVNLQFSF